MMSNNEQLMQDALQGNKSSFKELYSYACSGNAEAQYYLALYYKELKGTGQDSDYSYWMQKAKDNGYVEAQDYSIPEPTIEQIENNQEESSNSSLKKLLMKFSFMGRINRTEYIISIIIAIVLTLIVTLVEDPIVRSGFNLAINVFWWSQCIRRLHDFGASGWYFFVPFVSWVYAAFPKGDVGDNEYGEAPK